ncbi:helix-turn-helix domain-containing protein [Mycobacterium sp. TNTM28]|uniref:Helix-turn-helix domain-containing protein n=1 Tax=[Mycobacterium] fortunisiensis TaxID=2600579 RepID=A0ABS6KU80_9MYCO|nr:helix-turn-helix domain-containing protein [[Mycobacterium] fortunisiensis]MBU9767120.1 helix-turn-helix domain-containing protein [[Mycobacterium] fortunisiensis]
MSTTDPAALAATIAAVLAATQSEPAPAPAPPTVLTVDEAADRLKVSRSLIYSQLRSGELRSVRLGRRRLIPAAEVDRIISEAA